MATYVLVHGAAHGGWCFGPLARILRRRGHEVYAPTLTGLGDRAHLLTAEVGLDTHITDIASFLELEDLRDVVLAGHSYGGLVITGVADRCPERVSHLAFLDAATPGDGKSLSDWAGPEISRAIRAAGRTVDGVELIMFPDTNPAGLAGLHGVTDPDTMDWMRPRLRPHPWRCFEQKLRLEHPEAVEATPQTHIVCSAHLRPDDPMQQAARQAGRLWTIDTGHDLMITEPEAVADLLECAVEQQPIHFAFLHGAAQGSWAWAEVIDALKRQAGGAVIRALALDAPGCGLKRGRDTAALGPDEIVTELIGDIEAAGLRDVVLVGHSLAGTILPRMAQRRPDLFRRLVYVAAAAPRPGRTFHDHHEDDPAAAPAHDAAALAAQLPLVELMRHLLCNDMTSEGADTLLGKLGLEAWPERMNGFTDWSYAGLAGTPASYVICLRDAIAPAAWQEARAARLHAERLVRIDAGHQVLASRPEALAEALLREAKAP